MTNLRLAIAGVAIVAACSSGGAAGRPSVTPAVSSRNLDQPFLFPDDPCEVLSPDDVAAASGLRIRNARRIPDIGEIIRAEKEGRRARVSFICSYDGENDADITISIPAVADQNAAAYMKERDAYFEQSHGQHVSGVGQDAWLSGGTALHVLVGKNAQFIVGARRAGDKSRDAVVAVAKAVIGTLQKR